MGDQQTATEDGINRNNYWDPSYFFPVKEQRYGYKKIGIANYIIEKVFYILEFSLQIYKKPQKDGNEWGLTIPR